MTDEQEFGIVMRQRIAEAQQLTGYSFAGLVKALDNLGEVEAARRFVAPGRLGSFPRGMRILYRAGLLSHTIEAAVIEFGRRGKLFTPAEVARAEDQLQMLRLFLGKKKEN